MALSRREFLRVSGGAAAALLGARSASASAPVRVGAVVPAGHPAAGAFRAGLGLGADEARRTAGLLGFEFEWMEAVVDEPAKAGAAARELIAAGARWVCGGVAAAHCAEVAKAIPESFLELRARPELKPDEPAMGHLAVNPDYRGHARTLVAGLRALGIRRFAVARPDPVLSALARSAGLDEVRSSDAQVLFAGNGAPGVDPLTAEIVSPDTFGQAVPVAWHDSLRRYGAAQLNERYVAKTGRGMDEYGWYGWFSVKLMAEAALRGQGLESCRTDGHKGAALSFANRRIKQPLYVVVSRSASSAEEVVDV